MGKIVIIGGGIAGLTAGVYARLSGYDVEIYEKHSIVGGECTGWDRRGYHIDNCIHWLIGTKDGTDLNKIWRTTGAIGDDTRVIGSDKMYTSELNGETITLWKDIERTRRELLELSPSDRDEIEKLIKMVRVGQKLDIPANKPMELTGTMEKIKMMFSIGDFLKIMKTYKGMDTQDLMDRFNHPLIRCMISDFCTRESMAQSFAMAYGNFTTGDGGIPEGGSRAMSMRMQDRLRSIGGKVYTDSSVERILYSGDRATAIKLADGSEVEADYIVCTCDTDYTFNKLLPYDFMDDKLREMYEDRNAYPVYGMFQVAFEVDSDKRLLDGEMILDFDYEALPFFDTKRLNIKDFSYEPSFAPEGKQIIQALLGLREEGYGYWQELYKNREDYLEKKQYYAEAVLKKLEDRFPDYRGKINILDVWTPMTYKRYCNAYKGYNQSFMITKHSSKNPYPSALISELSNVVLAGQWILPPGGLPGAAVTGKYAIQRILHMENKPIDI